MMHDALARELANWGLDGERPPDAQTWTHFVSRLNTVVEDKSNEQAITGELERKLWNMTVLNRIMTAVSSATEPEKVLQTICRELVYTFQLAKAAVALIQEDKTHLRVVSEFIIAEAKPSVDILIPLQDNEATNYVLQFRKPYMMTYAQSDKKQNQHLNKVAEAHNTASILILPLIVKDEVIGTLALNSSEIRTFTEEEIQLAQNVSSIAGQALANAQLVHALQHELQTRWDVEKVLQEKISEERLISTISQKFNNLESRSFETIVCETIEAIGTFFHADHVCFEVNTRDSQMKENSAFGECLHWYLPSRKKKRGNYTTLSAKIKRWLCREKNNFAIPHNDDQHASTASPIQEWLHKSQIKSIIASPVKAFGIERGFIVVDTTDPQTLWDERHQHVLDTISVVIATAIERKQAADEIEQNAAELSALFRASTQLFIANNHRELAKQVAKTAILEFGIRNCSILLSASFVNEESITKQTTPQLLRFAQEGEYQHAGAEQLLLNGPGLIPESVRTGETIYVPDVSIDSRYLAGDTKTKSEYVVPLRIRDKVIGAMDFQSPRLHAFDEQTQHILMVYCEQVGLALQNVSLYEEARSHARELEQRILEQQKTETDLLTKTQELEAVFQAWPDLFFHLDHQGIILQYRAQSSESL